MEETIITRTKNISFLDLECLKNELKFLTLQFQKHKHKLLDIVDFPLIAGNEGKFLTVSNGEVVWGSNTVQIQTNWLETNPLSPSFILNKPTSLSEFIDDLVIDKDRVGLGNVDNTSDLNKPISSATQTALNLKADKSITISSLGNGILGGGDLSSNRTFSLDFTYLDNRYITSIPTIYYQTVQSVGLNVNQRSKLNFNSSFSIFDNNFNNSSDISITDVNWNVISNTPNTLAGYNIIDAEPTISSGTISQYWRGDKTFQTLDTSVIPENGNLYLTNSRVINSTLTGYVSSGGTITSSDNILQAIQKLNGNIEALVTGVSSVNGTSNRITSSGGANPTIDIASTYIGQSSITTLGTITTGIWNGTSITDSYISSANTWNAKQNALSGTGFVKSIGGVISYDTNTYLTTISGITAGGELAGTYANPTLVNSAVIGKILTGVNITGGTISSTDTILDAFGKVQNQINSLIGGMQFVDFWNASTNTPTIPTATGNKGKYYIVQVAGSTDIDGISDWQVGDWVVSNGTLWSKIDNTDAVVSVNGFTGIVNLTTANIPEVTNLYYTQARFDTAFGLKSTSNLAEGSNLYYTNARVNTQVATYTGDVTLSGTVFTIGAGKVTNAMLVNSTISGIALGTNLADLTATNTTLTFSNVAGYNGSTARSIGLNLSNANVWTVAQTFNEGIIYPVVGNLSFTNKIYSKENGGDSRLYFEGTSTIGSNGFRAAFNTSNPAKNVGVDWQINGVTTMSISNNSSTLINRINAQNSNYISLGYIGEREFVCYPNGTFSINAAGTYTTRTDGFTNDFTTLLNATLNMNASILPTTTNTRDIGSISLKFRESFVGKSTIITPGSTTFENGLAIIHGRGSANDIVSLSLVPRGISSTVTGLASIKAVGFSGPASTMIFTTSTGGAEFERLYIHSSGNVGIGTTLTDLGYKLQVNGISYFSNKLLIGTTTDAGYTAFDFNGTGRISGVLNMAASILPTLNTNFDLGSSTLAFATTWTANLRGNTSLTIRWGVASDLSFNNSTSEVARIFNTTGNFLLQNGGTFTDNGNRLQVTGNSSFSGNVTSTANIISPIHSVYGVGNVSATNFEVGKLAWNANRFVISSERGGTGSSRSIYIVSGFGGGSLPSLEIGGSGAFVATGGGGQHNGFAVGNSLTIVSTPQYCLGVLSGISASGTGSYRAVYVSPYLAVNTTTGSKLLMDVGYNTANGSAIGTHVSRLSISDLGVAILTGKLLVNTIVDAGYTGMDVNGNGRIQGKLDVSTGSNKSAGTATLVSGTVTVSTTVVTASSLIWVQYNGAVSGSSSILTTPTITAGISFIITAITAGSTTTNTSDNNVVKWWIIN